MVLQLGQTVSAVCTLLVHVSRGPAPACRLLPPTCILPTMSDASPVSTWL